MPQICEGRSVKDILPDVLFHRVSWRYDIGDVMLTDELREELEQHAEERARECIIDGYWSGQLCYAYRNEGTRTLLGQFTDSYHEFWGWWEIVS